MTRHRVPGFAPTVLCVLALLGTSCTGADDAALPPGVVAVVGADTLTEATLRDLLLTSPDLPTLDDARSLLYTWVNLALIGPALDRDPALASMQPLATATMLQEYAIRDFAESRAANGRAATDAEIDSVIRLNGVRTFDSYAIAADPRTDSAGFGAAIQLLEELRRAAVQTGALDAAFDAMPAASRNRFELVRLAAVERGELPPGLAEQIWPMQIGEVSQIIAGGQGVQLFTRRNTAEFRSAVADWLRPRLQAVSDAAVVDSIAAARHFRVTDGALTRTRAAMTEPGRVSGEAALATWDGGELTPEEATRRIGAIAPDARAALGVASDTAIVDVLTRFGRGELLYEVAAAGVSPARAAEHQQAVQSDFVAALDSIAASRNRLGNDGRNPTSWLQAILGGRERALALPGALGAVLRDGADVVVNTAGLDRAAADAARTWAAPTP